MVGVGLDTVAGRLDTVAGRLDTVADELIGAVVGIGLDTVAVVAYVFTAREELI